MFGGVGPGRCERGRFILFLFWRRGVERVFFFWCGMICAAEQIMAAARVCAAGLGQDYVLDGPEAVCFVLDGLSCLSPPASALTSRLPPLNRPFLQALSQWDRPLPYPLTLLRSPVLSSPFLSSRSSPRVSSLPAAADSKSKSERRLAAASRRRT